MTLGRRRIKGALGPGSAALTLVDRRELQVWDRRRLGDSLSVYFGERSAGKVSRVWYWKKRKFVQVNAPR